MGAKRLVSLVLKFFIFETMIIIILIMITICFRYSTSELIAKYGQPILIKANAQDGVNFMQHFAEKLRLIYSNTPDHLELVFSNTPEQLESVSSNTPEQLKLVFPALRRSCSQFLTALRSSWSQFLPTLRSSCSQFNPTLRSSCSQFNPTFAFKRYYFLDSVPFNLSLLVFNYI